MCGFIFIYDQKIDLKKAKTSLDKMEHRGPDDQNTKLDENIFMGFNRLSIQDLSPKANQPMYEKVNKNDFYIMFNGEIYNFLDLKNKDTELRKLNFESSSDTEVISKLYSIYGIEKTIELLNGMFAFCIYDKKLKKIFLARDIFGQKPLYYFHHNNFFIASSEIKGITNYIENIEPDFFGSLNPILQTGISPKNYTMFKNIKRLLPGEILVFDLISKKILVKKHLQLKNLINENEHSRIEKINQNQLIDEYQHTLSKSVENHSISDAPIGVAASLGLDSTIILDLLKKNNNNKINCISYISHEDKKIFENSSIKKYFSNTTHFNFTEKNKNFIENLVYSTYYCESIGREDNMILSEVSKLAQLNKIKVLLTGDGADELFGSIDYQQKFYFNSLGYFNKWIRKFNLVLKNYFPLLFNILVYHSPRNDGYFVYPNHLSSLETTSNLLLYSAERKEDFSDCLKTYSFISNESEKNYQSIILDDLNHRFQRFLSRSDSYGMQNSVEVRLPFLDKNFVRLCLNTPISKKIKLNILGIKKKHILKKIAKNLNIPNEIIHRKKAGTDFLKKDTYIKLILNEDFKFLSEMFKVESSKLKQMLINSNTKFYSRELFSFLSAEVLFKMFIDKENPEELMKKYQEIIKK